MLLLERRSVLAVSAVIAVFPVSCSSAAGADWRTLGGDAAHTNFNPHERALGRRHVRRLRLAWKVHLGGVIDTQPTYASRVPVGRHRLLNLVFVGTEHGGVFAVDARSGQIVWHRRLRQQQTRCFANTPDERFGVSASPIVDRQRGRLYVIPADNAIHALSLSTGREANRWPLRLGLDPASYHVWGSPTLVGHLLYVPIASYCDQGSYRGGVQLTDVRDPRIIRGWWVVGPASQGGAIWGWGGAPVDVVDGSVYVATGNAQGRTEDVGYAEHVVRLTPDLRVLAADDPDVGPRSDADFSSAPLLFRTPGCAPFLAAIHKRGLLIVYRRHAIDRGPVQEIQVGDVSTLEASGTFAWSPPRQTIYVTADNRGFHGVVALHVSKCRLKPSWRVDLRRSMWTPSPPTVANGVVYFGTGRDAEVVALNASTGKLLWRSRKLIRGPLYAAPTVIDGGLFAASWDQHLYAFTANR